MYAPINDVTEISKHISDNAMTKACGHSNALVLNYNATGIVKCTVYAAKNTRDAL